MEAGQKHHLRDGQTFFGPQHLRVGFGLIVIAALMLGCSKSEKSMAEAPPQPQSMPAELPKQVLKPLPPQLNPVQDAVKRVFKDAAFLDANREPSFIAGDFNGDLSEDIAVVLKPSSGKLDQINEKAPPWILKDPFIPIRPGMTRLRIEVDDVLLAVIHGNGPDNWRDPQATQTYLLKNAVGSGLEAHSQRDFVARNAGKRMPRFQGDLIGQILEGVPGYFYYTGATYAWYNPKNFKEEQERRLVHSRAIAKRDD